jgi:ATP/maltotriose-dependent transcriptional regulator MalT
MNARSHRAKVRRPRLGEHMVSRPRLLALLDRSIDVPLTLVSAPAGFGKTTVLAEWYATRGPQPAWLSVDDGDRLLSRFVVSVLAALETACPSLADSTPSLLRRPRDIAAFEVGATLADQLFDAPHDVILAIDDFQQAACVENEDFLRGLLRHAPPSFHLMLATRHDPAMPLGRMRAQGMLNELREADLRFTADEVRSFLAVCQPAAADPAVAEALHAWTGGWIAVMRLASRALPTMDASALRSEIVLGHRHLMDFLVEEVLAKQDDATQDFLLRIAIAEPLTASLAAALVDQEPPEGCQTLLETLARDNLLLEPIDVAAGSFRVHPLLRRLLLHRLELEATADHIAALHVRASDWFAAQGAFDLAVRHRLAAGDQAGAATLVEQNIHALLNHEDWPTLDALLRLIPESLIQQSPSLLLATAWVNHLCGRLSAVRVILGRVRALLAAPNWDPSAVEAYAAECDSLELGQLLTLDRDPRAAVARACAAADRIPAEHRLPKGLAYIACGCALQSLGETAEAIRWLTAAGEQDEERIDAGSIRSLLGLVFVHRQAGDFPACRAVAAQLTALAERHDLPVAAAWGHWALGWMAYEHDELADAVTHFSAIAADHDRCHLSCVGDALFGLAFAYEALGKHAEADRALRQATDIVLDANALAFLPSIRAVETWLAVRRGSRDIALDWLRSDPGMVTEGNALVSFAHEGMIRVKNQLAEGSAESVGQAWRALAELRAAADLGHHVAQRAAIFALEALAYEAEDEPEAAVDCLGRSIDLAAPAGLCRAYLDLGPAIAPPLRRLAAQAVPTPYLERLIGSVMSATTADEPSRAHIGRHAPSWLADEVLTEREAEVLAGLCERRSYKEIGAALFISPNTVKRHACNIYAKLGVNNRQQALAKVERLGWSAAS